MCATKFHTHTKKHCLLITGTDAQVRPLKVELSGFYASDNARDHHTEQFELVHDSTPTPVFRRGLPFFFAVRFDRQFDPVNDVIRLQFGFGEC
jgi:transglutaminase 1